MPVDGVMAVIGAEGEDYKALLDGSSGGSQEAPAPAAPKPEATAPPKGADSAESTTKLPDQKAVSAAPAEAVNASIIRMPKMSDTMTEGTIVAWHKKEGDTVKSGDVLAEVETDKATMDLEAYEEGTLLYIGVKEGASVAVDEVIAVVGEKGANFKVLLDGGAPASSCTGWSGSRYRRRWQCNRSAKSTSGPVPANADTDLSYGGSKGDVTESNGRMKASPLAKRIAEEKGINLTQVHGTGPEGRIVKSDVESFVPGKATPAPQPAAPVAQPAAQAPAATSAPSPYTQQLLQVTMKIFR